MQKGLRNISAFILVAVPVCPVIADTDALKLSDFEYGAELTGTDAEIVRFTIRPGFVTDIQRRDLGDIRVFDADNRLVPSIVRKTQDTLPVQRKRLVVRPVRSGGKTTAYIVDRGRAHAASVKTLHLKWQRGKSPNVAVLSLEHSGDRQSWSALIGTVTVANFNFKGVMLRRNDIDINRHTKRYIRLSYKEVARTPVLASVEAETTDKPLAALDWVQVDRLESMEGHPDQYRFTLPGGIRPELLKLNFRNLNSIITGSLSVMGTVKGKSRLATVMKPYTEFAVTLNNQVVKSRAVDIRQWPASEWIVSAGKMINVEADKLPGVMVAYPQYEVVFSNTGSQPYTAAWGYEDAGAPQSGELVERIGRSSASGETIPRVSTGVILDNAKLTALMESRQTSWLLLVVSGIAACLIGLITWRVLHGRKHQ